MYLPAKYAADFANMSIPEALQLPLNEYLQYLRDGYIYATMRRPGGLEYLEECWLMEQTTPDRKALRSKFEVQS